MYIWDQIVIFLHHVILFIMNYVRKKVTEYALPVTVGSHSWIGGDVVITPGVTNW